MSVFNNNLLLGAAGQAGGAAFDTTLIPNSVWLDGSADTFTKTFASGSAQTKIVISMWVQRNSFTSGSSQDILCAQGGTGGASRQNRIHFQTDDTIDIQLETTTAKTIIYSTTKVFRDIGWYHILLSIDQGQSVGPAQVNLFVNGVAVTIAATVLDQGFTAALSSWGNTALHSFGSNNGNALFYKGYYAQTTMLVGESIQAGDVAVTDFLDSFTYGTNGTQFGPKANADVAALASSAGGNSFCLDFANSSDLGNDISSNNNDFSLTSMAAANQLTNTPSLVFPVLNAIDSDPTLAASLGFGNRLGVGVSDWDSVFSTLPMGKTGKWYFEVRLHTDTASNGFIAGIHETNTTALNYANYIGNSTATFGLGYSLYTAGSTFTNNTETNNSLADIDAGDVVMMAVDLDNNKIWWGENGTFYLSGNPATGANPIYTLESDTEYVFGISPSTDEDYFVNFGADSTFGGAISAGNNADENGIGDFKHAPPAGFLSLCSANLTTPEAQGVDNFAVTLAQEGSLFSAMGTAEADFTGSGTVRIYKSRTSGSGAESWGYSFSHDATKEYVLPSLNGAMTHGSLRTLSGTDNWAGYSIGIAEDAGTAMGVQAHSNGSDTTITHGLTTSRCIILLFNRSGGDILYFHPDVASGTLLKLNNSVLPFSSTIITDVTTTTFDIGAAAASATYDYLVLAETPGVTDIFSYIGTSNVNGPFIAINARPELMVSKLTTTHATEHVLLDKARYPFNGPAMPLLMPNQIAAESSSTAFNTDFLASSLKIRNTATDTNFNGGVFVGWAFGSIAGNGTLPPIYGE